MLTSKGIVRFRSILSSLGNYDYPQVVTYTPLDDESRVVYQALGFTLPLGATDISVRIFASFGSLICVLISPWR